MNDPRLVKRIEVIEGKHKMGHVHMRSTRTLPPDEAFKALVQSTQDWNALVKEIINVIDEYGDEARVLMLGLEDAVEFLHSGELFKVLVQPGVEDELVNVYVKEPHHMREHDFVFVMKAAQDFLSLESLQRIFAALEATFAVCDLELVASVLKCKNADAKLRWDLGKLFKGNPEWRFPRTVKQAMIAHERREDLPVFDLDMHPLIVLAFYPQKLKGLMVKQRLDAEVVDTLLETWEDSIGELLLAAKTLSKADK